MSICTWRKVYEYAGYMSMQGMRRDAIPSLQRIACVSGGEIRRRRNG